MRDRLKDVDRLRHIDDIITQIMSKSFDQWLKDIDNDPLMAYALVKLIEMIGEATYRLTKEFRESHSDTPWDTIEGMRHVLVHDYYKIKLPRVIDVVRNCIPDLQSQIKIYISEFE